MTFKCLECGHIFEDGEEARWNEGRGEYWGAPCSEEMSGCPLCNGDYEETKPCEICGSEHLEDELYGGVCEECIDEYRNDFKACYDISKKWQEENGSGTTYMPLPDIFTVMFEPNQIEEILLNYAIGNCRNTDLYVDVDIDWFGEMIQKTREVNMNEYKKKQS